MKLARTHWRGWRIRSSPQLGLGAFDEGLGVGGGGLRKGRSGGQQAMAALAARTLISFGFPTTCSRTLPARRVPDATPEKPSSSSAPTPLTTAQLGASH
jgi:hypothetical protein